PVARRPLRRQRRTAVNHPDLQRAGEEVHRDLRAARLRMAAHVGQRLLDDAVCREVQSRWEVRWVAAHLEVDLEAGVPSGLDEVREGGDPGLRGQVLPELGV